MNMRVFFPVMIDCKLKRQPCRKAGLLEIPGISLGTYSCERISKTNTCGWLVRWRTWSVLLNIFSFLEYSLNKFFVLFLSLEAWSLKHCLHGLITQNRFSSAWLVPRTNLAKICKHLKCLVRWPPCKKNRDVCFLWRFLEFLFSTKSQPSQTQYSRDKLTGATTECFSTLDQDHQSGIRSDLTGGIRWT